MLRLVDLLVRIRTLSGNINTYHNIGDGVSPGEYSENIVENLIFYFNERSSNIQHLLEDLDKYITKLEGRNAIHSTGSEK